MAWGLKVKEIAKRVKGKATEALIHEDMGSAESWNRLFVDYKEEDSEVVRAIKEEDSIPTYDYEQKEHLEEELRQAYHKWNMLYAQYQTCTDEDYEKILYQRLVSLGGKRKAFKWDCNSDKAKSKDNVTKGNPEELGGEIATLRMCLSKLGQPPVSRDEELSTLLSRQLSKFKKVK